MSTQIEEQRETEEEVETEPETESPGERRRAVKRERAAQREQEVEDALDEAEETVELKVFRYDPEVADKEEPRFDSFTVPYHKGMTVLDALIYARDVYDSSLTFRHSCRQAVCGSDALFVNGRQRLGCKTQMGDLEWPVRIEPLPHQDVVKDLVVDMEHFYEQMHAVEPYFDPDETPDGELEEQRQTPENREKIKLSTRCIWCGACMSSCNIAAGDNKYLGPAAMLQEDIQAAHQMHRVDILIFSRFARSWRCSSSSPDGSSSVWKYGSTASIWS